MALYGADARGAAADAGEVRGRSFLSGPRQLALRGCARMTLRRRILSMANSLTSRAARACLAGTLAFSFDLAPAFAHPPEVTSVLSGWDFAIFRTRASADLADTVRTTSSGAASVATAGTAEAASAGTDRAVTAGTATAGMTEQFRVEQLARLPLERLPLERPKPIRVERLSLGLERGFARRLGRRLRPGAWRPGRRSRRRGPARGDQRHFAAGRRP